MQEISPALLHAATLVLLVFGALALVDGVYIHLIRLRLHERPASRLEHLWHSAASVLAVPAAYAMFAVVSGGLLLWLGIGLIVLGQAVEWLDMISEKESRAPLGGLGSFEYVLHGILSASRSVAVALSLAARPASAFALSSPSILGTPDEPYGAIVWTIISGAVVIAALHLWLAFRKGPQVVRDGAAHA